MDAEGWRKVHIRWVIEVGRVWFVCGVFSSAYLLRNACKSSAEMVRSSLLRATDRVG